MKHLDPGGVERRSRHKLKRSTYSAKGPNFIWHLDGYEKLKPFGFSIPGAIDGYSRRILGLEVRSSNNNPRVVARYYLDCVKDLGGVPRTVRGDGGTVNVNVAAMQCFFLGRRVQTQWLERRVFCMDVQSPINELKLGGLFFERMKLIGESIFSKNLREVGLYCDDDALHVECLQFRFLPLLKEELNHIAQHWNLHKIRPSINQESPPGRPDVLYFLPELKETISGGDRGNVL